MHRTLTKFGILCASLFLVGQGCLSLNDPGPQTSGPAGLFVSTDKGEVWQSISLLPTTQGVRDLSGVSVYRLHNDPQDAAALYWASRNNGFFFSYDEGRSWQQPKGDLATGFVYSVAVDPRDRCTIFASTGQVVHRSEDCSRSWQEVFRVSDASLRVMSLVFNPISPDQLVLLTSNGDVTESRDSGKTWQVLHRFNVGTAEIFADPLQRDVFYVAGRFNGLFRSIDGGASWDSLAGNMADFSGANEYRRFYMHPQKKGVLYWVSTYGIIRSDNGGDTWEAIDLITPPGSVQIYGFAVNPRNENELYYTATINNRSTFYRSFDGGVKWTTKKLPSGQLPTLLYVHPEKEEVVYLGFTIPPN